MSTGLHWHKDSPQEETLIDSDYHILGAVYRNSFTSKVEWIAEMKRSHLFPVDCEKKGFATRAEAKDAVEREVTGRARLQLIQHRKGEPL